MLTSWFLIQVSKTKNQGSLEKWTDFGTGAENIQDDPGAFINARK